MMSVVHGDFADNDQALLVWIDQVADTFEAAWRAGINPRISDFLEGLNGERRRALARELILIDSAYRRSNHHPDSTANDPSDCPELSVTGCSSGAFTAIEPDVAEQFRATAVAACPEYEILESLGCGGMGVVFRARHRQLKRNVAIKMIVADGRSPSDARSRFWTEAEAIARLQHPHIVQIHEVGAELPHFVLEYVAGGNLSRRLDGRPRPARESAQLVEKLARAIQHAHDQGIVHRDLKPANVLLTADGEPKIADFGLAKLLDSNDDQTRSGALLGTPSYMAPEQASGNGREIGPASDIYALGAILYEMLAGRPPFRGLTTIHTLQQVRSDEPVSPRRLQPTVPRDLETICLRALAKAPTARYSSAAALADDLRRFLDGRPILARPAGPVIRILRWCRRSPFKAAIALSAAAITLGIFVFTTLMLHLRAETRQRDLYEQQLAAIVHGNHPVGWSRRAEDLVRLAARSDYTTPRQLAFASLAGLDARLVRKYEGFGASTIAFDVRAERFALGSTSKNGDSVRVYRGLTEEYLASEMGGGPVTFDENGTALQLAIADDSSLSLVLWDIDRQKAVCTANLPQTDRQRFARVGRDDQGRPLLAISRDGRFFAAAAIGATDDGVVAVWDRTGKCRMVVPTRAAALALSDGGKRLAICDPKGHVWLWQIDPAVQAAEFRATRATPLCLAFSRDEKRLSLGDSAGVATIWDLTTYLPVAYCRGSLGNVSAVAFSPDGAMLATGAADRARIWDASTGQSLLEFSQSQGVAALAFSDDGARFGLVTRAPTHVFIYDLQYGRGILTLRGLTGQLSAIAISRDGSTVAALDQNWRIAVWDGRTGRQRRTIEVKPIGTPVHAALILSDDGSRLALANNLQARIWDLTNGADTGSWSLPEGENNCLMFGNPGELFLLRFESDDRTVGRIRNLLGPKPLAPKAEVCGFDLHLFCVTAGCEAMQFVVDGTGNESGVPRRKIAAFDARTGVVAWSVDSRRSALDGLVTADAGGRAVAFRIGNDRHRGVLAKAGVGPAVQPLAYVPIAFNRNANYAVFLDSSASRRSPSALVLGHFDRNGPLTILETDLQPTSMAGFDRAGQKLVWSRQDGILLMCDLESARIRLASLGLGW